MPMMTEKSRFHFGADCLCQPKHFKSRRHALPGVSRAVMNYADISILFFALQYFFCF